MSGEGEIIGDIAQSVLIARAAEPVHGESADGHSAEAACLNCGTALVGSHCHACGQAAHVHKTLGAFFHDLLHGVFHFEGKIWRTLPLLAWNPGRLTREYIDGRRASYVSPIALFLFCVFLMFAVVKQFAGGFDPTQTVNVDGSVKTGVEQTAKHLDGLKRERAALVAQGQDTARIDGQIESDQAALEIMREVKATGSNGKIWQSDIKPIDHALRQFQENPKLAIYKLQSNAYKYSWALIPISVPFVWLLFPFSRRFRLYDHTVFVTYSLAFMTLLAVVLTLGNAANLPLIGAAGTFVPPLHMYRQLRGTYGLSRASALWRTLALLAMAFSALVLFAVLIFAQSGA
ncbi:MAG TPA: DUF3667 domain-containing protein [Novosphingobium sp.]|nr:DUF3667 domain-containing protein [Novosphingobium sp.]HNN55788.1 DUF3667 domain-containing protein [Novosphingobium sp.]